MKILAIALSIIPGIGHIVIGRYIRGIIFFFIFSFFLNGIFIGLYLYEGKASEKMAIIKISGACALLIWIYSMYNIYRLTKQDIKGKTNG